MDQNKTMNKYKEALQEIINLYNSKLPLNKNTVKRCQQALEQSEPRMFSYSELESFGINLMSGDYIHTINNNQELVQYCKKQAEHFIQSLSPKGVKPNKWDKMNKEFNAALDHAKNNGYFEKFSILPESSNPIATDHTTIQPNNE